MDWSLLSIPVIAGVIGLVTNFAGIKLLFFPVRQFGVRVPGLSTLAQMLPRKLY